MKTLKYARYFFNTQNSIFIIKLFIAGVILALILYPMVGRLSTSINKLGDKVGSRVNSIYLKGMVTNPVALLEASYVNESNNRIDAAILDMKLAIGILEINAIKKEQVTFYTNRLADLERKERVSNDKNK